MEVRRERLEDKRNISPKSIIIILVVIMEDLFLQICLNLALNFLYLFSKLKRFIGNSIELLPLRVLKIF